ncbi:MAG: DUF1667 domain-containing protein [Candidatus Limiplasma sp.]|nr:DUF1667 domain-containing protein [Candidatus Limiplasma sp.]MEA5146618.1 DUF1667 domain-containing protein [Candidatus Limiplasma sp.]
MRMEHLITCINCPIGCRMTVEVTNGQVTSVTGNSCKRGITYAAQESIAPRRMVTAVVWVRGSRTPLSVKTREPIPKDKVFACMQALQSLTLQAPICQGDVILPDVCASGVDVIATKSIPRDAATEP